MSDARFPVWILGKDDEFIRQHLGTSTLPDFDELMRQPLDEFANVGLGPSFRPGRFPRPRVPLNRQQPANPREPWSLLGRGSIELYKLAREVRQFGQVAWRFTLGPGGKLVRFQKNYSLSAGKWNWKSIRFEQSHRFRSAVRSPVLANNKRLKVHHGTMGSRTASAEYLRLGAFNAKGLIAGTKRDFRWVLVGTGAEAAVKWYFEGHSAAWNYLTDSERFLDLSKAVVAGALTTLVTIGVAGATTIAIVPITVGVVASVLIGCALDEATDTDNICRAGVRMLTPKSPQEPPLPVQPTITTVSPRYTPLP